MAPSYTDADADTASDNDTAVLAAVIIGHYAKAMQDCEIIPPRHEGSHPFSREVMSWYAQYGTNYEQLVQRDMLPAGTETKCPNRLSIKCETTQLIFTLPLP